MYKIDSQGATAAGQFKETPAPATRVDAAWLNMVQSELISTLALKPGTNPDKTKNTQLRDVIADYVGAGLSELSASLLESLNNLIVLTTGAGGEPQRSISFAGGLFIVKLGYMRETIVDEVTRRVTFDEQFPNGCWQVFTSDVIAEANTHRNLWTQIIPALTTADGFTVQFQVAAKEDKALSGFDWMAIGS